MTIPHVVELRLLKKGLYAEKPGFFTPGRDSLMSEKPSFFSV
jgi:hypothetical protein